MIFCIFRRYNIVTFSGQWFFRLIRIIPQAFSRSEQNIVIIVVQYKLYIIILFLFAEFFGKTFTRKHSKISPGPTLRTCKMTTFMYKVRRHCHRRHFYFSPLYYCLHETRITTRFSIFPCIRNYFTLSL